MFLLALATSTEASKYQFQNLKETNMMFYMQDWETGANATATPVASIPHKRWWILGFGTIFATDDKLTVAIERNSSEVGRAHGIYVNSTLDGSNLHLLMSLVFTNKEYNGSTLELQGTDRLYQKEKREMYLTRESQSTAEIERQGRSLDGLGLEEEESVRPKKSFEMRESLGLVR
ncbi:hypothetical protein CMV_006251 [Castanea mollissima]|uniref:Dirigent protein n=1 Tax=Castanea mollissima TaxID=60419 RepID=A0A8J4RHG6_9ROSI|nr:hypothetical protein CMV_006251 [Castanea mollissima]